MANINDIARMAEVSVSTVSRVINNDKYVSDKTRKRVKDIISETGYSVNGNAVRLSQGKNYILGVQIPYNNSCYEKLIDSILLNAKRKGYQIQLMPTYYEQESERQYYSLLERKNLDGLILTSRTTQDIQWERLLLKGKIVSTEKIDSQILPMIYPDREKVYYQIFSYLNKHKFTNIVFTVKRSISKSMTTRYKVRAYEKYFGTAKEGENYFTGIDSFNTGYEWAKEIAKKSNIPEFIYANGDSTAAGIITAFKEYDLVHKKDFRLIGEGNEHYSSFMEFSTIDFFPRDIGKEAVDFLTSEETYIKEPKEPKFIIR